MFEEGGGGGGAESCTFLPLDVRLLCDSAQSHSNPHTGGEEEVSGFDLILDTQLDVCAISYFQ